MLTIPFPLVLAEIFLFFMSLTRLGFLNTMLIYFAPCLLGLFIIMVYGKFAMGSLRYMKSGEALGNKTLHILAIVISGICFLVPGISSRLLGIVLLLPGLRHLLIWKMKAKVMSKMANGSFQFGGMPFGRGGGFARGPQPQNPFEEKPVEREVQEAQVLDIRPLEVTHTIDKDDKDKK